MSSCPVHTCPHTIVDTYHKRHRNVRTSLSLSLSSVTQIRLQHWFSPSLASPMYISRYASLHLPPAQKKTSILSSQNVHAPLPRVHPSRMPRSTTAWAQSLLPLPSRSSFSLLLTPQAQVKPKPKSTSTLSLSPRFVLQSEVSFWFDREIGKAEKTGFAPSI